MKRIAAYFSKENSIRGASIILIITLTLSNVLGMFRDRFLTKNILTYDLDVYYAAFRIPDLIFNFLILGAISSAFIPIFSDFLTHKEEEKGYRVTNILINIGLLFTILSAVVLYFLMPHLVPLVVPSFDPNRMALTVRYSRLLMITPIIFCVSYIIGAVLNCYKRFVAYSFAPIIYNLSIIYGAAVLAPKYGLTGVIYSVIAGALLHLSIQIIPVLKLGYRYQLIISFTDKSIKRIFRLMIPRTISMGSSQLMLIAYTAIASALAAGSITAFNLANNIQTMPVVVLGTSFATAVFPVLAAKISAGEDKDFSILLDRTLKAMGYLLIPSTVIFIMLRAQIIRLILGSGKFDWDDTRMTAITLGFLSISILAQGIIPLITKAFYALKNTRTPMYISIVTVIVAILLGYPLSKSMSVAGLALAYSIASYVNLIILIYFLWKKYPKILNKSLLLSYLKTTISTVFMAAGLWLTMHLVANYVNMNKFVGILEQTAATLIVGLIIFFAMSYILDQEEISWALRRQINVQKNSKENS